MTAISVLSPASPAPATVPARIVVAGGSGQIGCLLARHFHASGHKVLVLARTTLSAPWPTAAWDGEQLGPWLASLYGADVLINLAGRSVNDAWMLEVGAVLIGTETELILKSRRVVPSRLLALGFQFEFPYWSDAAKNLVTQWRIRRAEKENQ